MPIRDPMAEIFLQNDLVTYAYSQYLNRSPRFLTAEMVESLAKECQLKKEDAFRIYFAAACGFDTADNDSHREIDRHYIQTGVEQLDPRVYQNDLYHRLIKFPEKKTGKWEMRHEFYAPYEPFVWNHPILTPQLREIPRIGFFDQRFDFPAILENGIEWMTVTPNEIETMRQPIEKSHGRVLTLGLGLGYFAFHASEKNTVERVTVIERDQEVIRLFQNELLPQFPHSEKIDIICADALDYMLQKQVKDSFDFIFADLWHDQSDGLDLYLRLRRIEKQQQLSNVEYWIEPTLLSALRHMVWQMLNDPNAPKALKALDCYTLLQNDYLHRLAPDLRKLETVEK